MLSVIAEREKARISIRELYLSGYNKLASQIVTAQGVFSARVKNSAALVPSTMLFLYSMVVRRRTDRFARLRSVLQCAITPRNVYNQAAAARDKPSRVCASIESDESSDC